MLVLDVRSFIRTIASTLDISFISVKTEISDLIANHDVDRCAPLRHLRGLRQEIAMSTTPNASEVPVVPYFLVLLVPGPNHAAAAEHFAAHVEFIDAMAAANVVLLGGAFKPTIAGAEGAYLLHTASMAEAEEWASKDPLVGNAVYTPRIVTWNLVGIARGAIDPALGGA
jgi:uncharacterized protein YciI